MCTVFGTEKYLSTKYLLKSVRYAIVYPSHNLKVIGSNPIPATKLRRQVNDLDVKGLAAFHYLRSSPQETGVVSKNQANGGAMMRSKPALVAAAIGLVTSLSLVAGARPAAAQSLPPSGLYQCTNASGIAADLNFTVGPGEIYTTPRGWRSVMTIHPGSGNILFHGPTPQSAYQGRYNPGPPPRVELLTVTDGTSSPAGITCQLR
jgi:hypothetical protein